MKKLIRIILLLFFFSLYLLLLPSCKKRDTVDTTNGTGNTPGNGSNSGCTATKTDAENIQFFPPDNPWNKDISAEPVDPNNTSIISAISGNAIKADFGSGLWNGAPIGIPYIVVCGNQSKIPVAFTDYGDESDPGPYTSH